MFARTSTLLIRRVTRQNGRYFSSQHYDAVIVGGGVVGLTMAKLLQEQCPRYTVALLDRGGGVASAETTTTTTTPTTSTTTTTIPHPRSYALSPKSMNLLGETVLSNIRLGSYDAMQIWESASPAMLVFSQHDLDGQQQFLGACVEDSALTSSLYQALLEGSSSLSLRTKTALSSFKVQGNKVELSITDEAITDNKESSTISTSLLIAADGGQSPIRQTLGIPWRGLDYGRTAITFTVELLAKEASVNKRAYQRFLPHGPIALLPTYSSNHAVVVWSTTPEEALELKGLDAPDLVERLNETLQQGPQRLEPLFERVGGTSPLASLAYGVDRVLDTIHYGMGMRHWSDDPNKFLAPPLIADVVSPKFTFPLSCKVAASMIADNRIALIGDAAHTVHPLAGQGLNIGLEDVAALAAAIQKSHDSGMDSAQFLSDYQSNRQIAIPAKVGGIHLLHSLFGMQSAPLKHGKSIGMSLVNQVGPLRRQLAKIATGLD